MSQYTVVEAHKKIHTYNSLAEIMYHYKHVRFLFVETLISCQYLKQENETVLRCKNEESYNLLICIAVKVIIIAKK